MKFYVNEDCIGCGLCVSTCPEVFSMSEEGTAKAVDEDAAPDVQSAAEEAKDNCPVSAIETVEE